MFLNHFRKTKIFKYEFMKMFKEMYKACIPCEYLSSCELATEILVRCEKRHDSYLTISDYNYCQKEEK